MFIVEGNIGAGKSTFLRLLGEKLPWLSVSLEPVQNWNAEDQGQSILNSFYTDPKRWAYTFETLTMLNRVRDHIQEQCTESNARFVERSIYSGHYCFAKNSHQSGFLNGLEWQLYQEFFQFLTRTQCEQPQGFIYLRVDPATSYERMKRRNRSAESTVPLEYLEDIHRLHDEFLIDRHKVVDSIKKTPVLVLDCNEEFESNEILFAQHCVQIKEFIQENSLTIEQTFEQQNQKLL